MFGEIYFRGGPFGRCANSPKNIEHMLLVKNSEFLRRKKISGSLNQGVAKDFEWCVTAPKVAVSHMIRDWASHFLMRDLAILQVRRVIYQLDFLLK